MPDGILKWDGIVFLLYLVGCAALLVNKELCELVIFVAKDDLKEMTIL